MILKVMSADNEYEWHYIDCIRVASISKVMSEKVSVFHKRVWSANDTILVPRYSVDKDGGIAEDFTINFRELWCESANGDDFTVVFSEVAFLLNDNGDTVDRFHIK